MNKTINALVLGTAMLMASTSLSTAFEDGKLVVWINGDKGFNGLQAVGDKFAEELGVEVVVEHPDAVTDKFQQSAATGDGPDIFIWAHDRFGEWAAAGLIAPVEPSAEIRDGIFDFTWDAVTFDGKTWGYPMAVEAVGLIYNKDLVSNPPATFEEIASLELPDGVAPILWDYNNTYFTFPLLMANGGYAFQKDASGSFDATDTGVNNEGAKKGAVCCASLSMMVSCPRALTMASWMPRSTKAKWQWSSTAPGPGPTWRRPASILASHRFPRWTARPPSPLSACLPQRSVRPRPTRISRSSSSRTTC